MSRPLIRNPIIPLPLSQVEAAKPNEIIFDYQNQKFFVKNEDGTISPVLGGSGSSGMSGDYIDLTKEQYDNLTEEEKDDPTKLYFIIEDEDYEEQSYENIIITVDREQYDAMEENEKHNGAIYLIRNGRYSNDNEYMNIVTQISQREYDALSEEEKDSDTIFFIYDGEVPTDFELIRTITQAEYDSLSDEVKNSETLFFITDSDNSGNDIPLNEYETIVTTHKGTVKLGHYIDHNELIEPTGGSSGTALIIGNGTPEEDSNAVIISYNGTIKADGPFVSLGADYAEYFEWAEGALDDDKEFFVRRFVTIDGDKIKLANYHDDYILGVISTDASIIGNSKLQASPDASPIALLGVVEVEDDGTCEVNKLCRPGYKGIATKSFEPRFGYRVIARVHPNVVKIILK